MGVALVGSVSNTRVTSGTTLALSSWAQSPTAGNLLVAVISRIGSSTASAPSITGASGWTRLLPTNYVSNIGVGSATSCNVVCDCWYRAATGGDTLPSFTMSGAGATLGAMVIAVYELSGANTTTPLDVSGTFSGGASSATVSSITTTTSANVTASGEFAISAACRERAAGTPTVTYSASWVNGFNDGSTSSTAHTGTASLAAPTSGATASDVTSFSGTATSSFAAGFIVVIAAAVPVAGNPPGGAIVHRRFIGGYWGGAGQAGSNAAGSFAGTASLSGSGTLTAAPVFAATAAMSGSGTLTASP